MGKNRQNAQKQVECIEQYISPDDIYIYNEHFCYPYMHNILLPLAPDYNEHIYSAVIKTRKSTDESNDTIRQVVAVYSLAT